MFFYYLFAPLHFILSLVVCILICYVVISGTVLQTTRVQLMAIVLKVCHIFYIEMVGVMGYV